MKITVHHVYDQDPHLHIRGAMVHPDTDPEALDQDKPALTVLVVMGHSHELTMNIDIVRVNNLGGHMKIMIQGTLQQFPHQGGHHLGGPHRGGPHPGGGLKSPLNLEAIQQLLDPLLEFK